LTTGEAGDVQFTIESIVYEGLTRFCKQYQVTPFVVLLAAFRTTHYRFSGVEDASIATPVANRRDREELENLIGFFVNTLCLRIRIDEDTSFRELVKRAQKKSTDAQSNQDIPFEKIVAELS
jgi:non-ribosomal peptide synthetase component F